MMKVILKLIKAIVLNFGVKAVEARAEKIVEQPQDMTGLMMHEVAYNSQRDNFSFGGKFAGFRQCFSTCAYMLIAYFTKLDGDNDEGLARYVDDVEANVGKPGIGEYVKKKYNWITGNTSLWWLTQKYGIEKWIWAEGIRGDAVFIDKTGDWQAVIDALKISPVLLGTNKLGNLKGGHIILLTGFRKGEFIVNDPYGDAKTNYSDHNGESVIYSLELLQKHSEGKPRFMYWRPL